MDGGKEKRPLTENFVRAWTSALLAVSSAEDEASKLLQKVAEVAGWSQDEVKRHAREFTERLATQRRDLEKDVEESVKKAVSRLKVPRREEIQDLESRISRLAARLDAQIKERA